MYQVFQGNKPIGHARKDYQKALQFAYEQCKPDCPTNTLSKKEIANMQFTVVEIGSDNE